MQLTNRETFYPRELSIIYITPEHKGTMKASVQMMRVINTYQSQDEWVSTLHWHMSIILIGYIKIPVMSQHSGTHKSTPYHSHAKVRFWKRSMLKHASVKRLRWNTHTHAHTLVPGPFKVSPSAVTLFCREKCSSFWYHETASWVSLSIVNTQNFLKKA